MNKNQPFCFLEKAGEKYRLLKSCPAGCWLISYDNSAPPFFVSSDELAGYKRIPTPAPYLEAMREYRTKAQRMRYDLIIPLLGEDQNITDKAHRHSMAANIAIAHNTTIKRVLRLYYRYLATGRLTASKPAAGRTNKTYDWAIRTFYYSSKRLSLRAAYEMMLVEKFTKADGSLSGDARAGPGFSINFTSIAITKSRRRSLQERAFLITREITENCMALHLTGAASLDAIR